MPATRRVHALARELTARRRGTTGWDSVREFTIGMTSSPSSNRAARARGRRGLRRSGRAARRGAASTSRRSRPRSQRFAVAVPSWGVGTGGTRFGRFPGPGEPRGIHEKLEDCAVIQQLVRITPTRLAAFPLGQGRGLRRACASRPRALGLGFDAVNSNTFQDQPGQAPQLQVRLADPHRSRRARAGGRSTTWNASRSAGSSARKALTVWIARRQPTSPASRI